MVAPGGNDRVDAGSLGPISALDSGGQGKVYEIANDPATVYKEYNAAARAALDPDALTAMVRLPAGLPAADAAVLTGRCAWPSAVVTRGGRDTGFLMPRVPHRFYVTMTVAHRVKWTLGGAQLLLNDNVYLHNIGLAVTDRFRLEFLLDTAETLAALHRLDIAVGDLSPKNLCFSLASRPRCYFIDCDAMRMRGMTALPQLETDDWQVPTGEPKGTAATDAYKFALLAIRLFAGEQNAIDPGPLHVAGSAVQQLAERGLSHHAGQRPAAAEWGQALEDSLRALPQPFWSRATGTARVPSFHPPRQQRTNPPRAAACPSLVGPGPAMPPPWVTGPAPARVRPGTLFATVLVTALMALLCLAAPRVGDWRRGLLEALNRRTPDPAGQADAMADLLADSSTDRERVNAAIDDIQACHRLSAAGAALDSAAAHRGVQFDRANRLDTSELAGGDRLRTELTDALSRSRAADEAYARWARAVSRQGCQSAAMHGAERGTGDAESKRATAAKKRFVLLWNPIAGQYGHPALKDEQI